MTDKKKPPPRLPPQPPPVRRHYDPVPPRPRNDEPKVQSVPTPRRFGARQRSATKSDDSGSAAAVD
jgi:hypothetical protein